MLVNVLHEFTIGAIRRLRESLVAASRMKPPHRHTCPGHGRIADGIPEPQVSSGQTGRCTVFIILPLGAQPVAVAVAALLASDPPAVRTQITPPERRGVHAIHPLFCIKACNEQGGPCKDPGNAAVPAAHQGIACRPISAIRNFLISEDPRVLQWENLIFSGSSPRIRTGTTG